MQTVRGNLIYTAIATAIFLGIQWMDSVRELELLAISGAMFFAFTFLMLRLVQRILGLFIKNRPPTNRNARGRRGAAEERGPAEVPMTTDRPEHVRRRRERRRRH